MKHYVYIITDPVTSEYYIGRKLNSIDPETDNYMGSYTTWEPKDKHRLIKEIIKDDFDSTDDAIEYEIKLIKEHIDNDLNRNYHIPTVGFNMVGIEPWNKGIKRPKHSEWMSNRVISEETREKHRKRFLNHSPATLKSVQDKMKQRAQGRYTLEWFIERYGVEVGTTKYHKRNLKLKKNALGENNSQYGKTGKNHPASKSIIQCDLNGEFIKKWDSITQASKGLKINGGGISACATGRQKTSGGYIWKFNTD